ncbi:MAG: serine/threonine-protein kinase [Pirellulales bacterium]
MSEPIECPPHETLNALAQGRLPETMASQLETHLGQCAACHTKFENLDRSRVAPRPGSKEGDLTTCEFAQKPGDRAAAKPVGAEALLPTRLGPADPAPHDDDEGPSLTLDTAQLLAVQLLTRSDTPGSLGKLKEYEVISILGQGGYGIVFEAWDKVLDRRIAIKVLTPDLAHQAISRRRFIREARAAAAINHPNVVTVFGVEESGAFPFLVMELLRGRSLRERLRRDPKLDLLDILRIGVQIAQGLAAAHAQGIVHRDVKPGNILLVDETPRVKITDFGLARVTADNIDFTSGGIAVGTPGYMSPEQVRGEELDTRSDLFALGCVLYAMFTGHSPFHGRSIIDIARRIDSFEPPRLRELGKAVPEFMDALVFRLLRKRAEDRYQSAAEVADILNRHLALLNQTPTDRLPAAFQRQLLEEQKVMASRSQLSTLAIAAVVAAVVGGGVYLATNRIANPPPHPGMALLPAGTELGRNPNGASAVEAPAPRLKTVSVAQKGEADCRTLAEAISRVASGGTIRVTDDGVYDEPLRLSDGENLAQVRIVAERGATIRQTNAAAVRIDTISGLTLAGFTIEVPQNQWGLEVRGECPGLTLDGLSIQKQDNPDGTSTSIAAVVFRSGASGAAEAPMRLIRSKVENAIVGVVCGVASGKEKLTQHVLVEDCRIRGNGKSIATLIAIMATADHIVLRRNIVHEGMTGISFQADADRGPTDCVIEHSTWFAASNWATWAGPAPQENAAIQFRNCLVVDTQAISPVLQQFAATHPTTFEGNIASIQSPPMGRSSESLFGACAAYDPDFPLQSRDPSQSGFLRPDFAKLAERNPPLSQVPGVYSSPTQP